MRFLLYYARQNIYIWIILVNIFTLYNTSNLLLYVKRGYGMLKYLYCYWVWRGLSSLTPTMFNTKHPSANNMFRVCSMLSIQCSAELTTTPDCLCPFKNWMCVSSPNSFSRCPKYMFRRSSFLKSPSSEHMSFSQALEKESILFPPISSLFSEMILAATSTLSEVRRTLSCIVMAAFGPAWYWIW